MLTAYSKLVDNLGQAVRTQLVDGWLADLLHDVKFYVRTWLKNVKSKCFFHKKILKFPFQYLNQDLAQLVLERSTVLKNILQNDTAKGKQTHQALLKAFTSVVARALETSSSELAWVSRDAVIYFEIL